MGVLNVTPDSFSDGGLYYPKRSGSDTGQDCQGYVNNDRENENNGVRASKTGYFDNVSIERACEHARRMIAAGASIIDVGGESTRPGSKGLSAGEELERVEPVVHALVKEGIVVSIDSYHAEVAAACIKQGASIINDVTGFTQAAMRELAEQSEVACIVMHMQGAPKDMQAAPSYCDVVAEVEGFLLAQAHLLEELGIERERIAIDPGPGFGKDFEHNLALLRATNRLASHGYPLVAAWSRKAFIGMLTDVAVATERVAGSVAATLFAVARGARILRVHDVSPTVQALKVLVHIYDDDMADDEGE